MMLTYVDYDAELGSDCEWKKTIDALNGPENVLCLFVVLLPTFVASHLSS